MEHTDVNMGDIFSALPPMQELFHYYELLMTLFPNQLHYDFSLVLTVLSCKETTPREDSGDKDNEDISGENSNFLDSLISFLNLGNLHQNIPDVSADSVVDDCDAFIKLNTTTRSAADGTLIGSADRFDVLLVLDISSHSELMVLHSNFSDEIPPGHIVLGAKGQNAHKEGLEFSRKTYIKGLFGYYLQAQNVLEKVETLLKKAVLRLNREHKSKVDSLPFSFQMSQSKRHVLTIDTCLLHSFGLGVGEINVRITPAIELSVAEYCLLPPLFAIPVIKNSASSSPAQSLTGNGAMSRLFHAKGIADLHWLIHTENLHSAIFGDFEKRLKSYAVRSHHKECLMVLKALFSSSHHNKLLNKGEVDSYILKTVVSFLLQESCPSAWTLENLANRVSDAIHFLRSAYENAWLPELSVHNPHLLEKMPSLKVMCHILHGRQRNLLAHVTNAGSLKVLDYVSQRLNETRLVHALNEHFSSEMWEYEFFMFG
ncbi:hypothetical protein RRG08_026491 [Elysia crispata]|uniref:Mab-21-like HhH/H2TH-like domain-containing protein n=1 Tax=Elysia crispata TaxID=231223 RepID=A0AAE0Y4B0_9GAST|nr:hypothetical protein RRG08_026491 [Elysia crispata]